MVRVQVSRRELYTHIQIIIIIINNNMLIWFIGVLVGSTIGRSFIVDVNEPKPNRLNTMNLVEKWAQELGLSENFNS